MANPLTPAKRAEIRAAAERLVRARAAEPISGKQQRLEAELSYRAASLDPATALALLDALDRAEAALRDAAVTVDANLDSALASLTNDGDPVRGVKVEAECPHGSNIDGCPWAEVHHDIRRLRAWLDAHAEAIRLAREHRAQSGRGEPT